MMNSLKFHIEKKNSLKCKKDTETKNPRLEKSKKRHQFLKNWYSAKSKKLVGYYLGLIHLLKDFLYLVVFGKT